MRIINVTLPCHTATSSHCHVIPELVLLLLALWTPVGPQEKESELLLQHRQTGVKSSV